MRRVVVREGPQLVIEDASVGSGAVVDARLTDVSGATYSDAEAKLKGRCFVLADDADPLLSQALREIGQPDATHARLRTRPVRDMLTGSMVKRILPWVVAGCLLTFAGMQALCVSRLRAVEPSEAVDVSVSRAQTVIPWSAPQDTAPSNWHPSITLPKLPTAYADRARQVAPVEYARAIESGMATFDPADTHREWGDELYRICLRESRCGQYGAVGAHAEDSWTGARAYLWEVIRGRLDPYSCPEHRLSDYAPVLKALRPWEVEHGRMHPQREKLEELEYGNRQASDFGTRGAFGMNAARAVSIDGPLGPCVPPEALDNPVNAAIVAAHEFANCTVGAGLFRRSCTCSEHAALWVGRGRWASRPFVSWSDKSKLSTVAVQCGRRYARVFAVVEAARIVGRFGVRLLAAVGWPQ